MAQKDTLNHPALHQLRVTPDIVRELMEGLSAEQAAEKASANEFSLAEFLEYVSHREAHYFRAVFDQIISKAETRGQIETYDQEALFLSGTYSGRDPEESLAHWEERRDDGLELIESLQTKDLALEIVHLDSRPMTLDGLLRAWAAHDLTVIQRIAAFVSDLLYADVQYPS